MSTIDRNVPIPPAANAKRRYPLEQLGLGDSVAFPHADYGRVTQAAHRYRGATPGWDYTARTVTENGTKRIRVWRVA